MNSKIKTVMAILLVAALVAGVGVWAATNFNMTGTVSESGVVTYTLDGSAWNGADIDWGTVDAGQSYNKPLNVDNGKNTQVTPILNTNEPAGWTVTWTLNNTAVNAGQLATGTLTLTVPAGATAGPFTFTCDITPDPGT